MLYWFTVSCVLYLSFAGATRPLLARRSSGKDRAEMPMPELLPLRNSRCQGTARGPFFFTAAAEGARTMNLEEQKDMNLERPKGARSYFFFLRCCWLGERALKKGWARIPSAPNLSLRVRAAPSPARSLAGSGKVISLMYVCYCFLISCCFVVLLFSCFICCMFVLPALANRMWPVKPRRLQEVTDKTCMDEQ